MWRPGLSDAPRYSCFSRVSDGTSPTWDRSRRATWTAFGVDYKFVGLELEAFSLFGECALRGAPLRRTSTQPNPTQPNPIQSNSTQPDPISHTHTARRKLQLFLHTGIVSSALIVPPQTLFVPITCPAQHVLSSRTQLDQNHFTYTRLGTLIAPLHPNRSVAPQLSFF